MFNNLKQAFERAVATLDALKETIKAQTEVLRAQNEALRAQNEALSHIPEIKTLIEAVAKSTAYLEGSERRGLQRSGHSHDF